MATQRRPAERTLEAELLGRDVTFDYSETWIAYSVVLLRVVMGWVFLQAGLEKYTANGLSGIQNDPLDGGFSAAGYLENAVASGNPAMGLWDAMAGAAWVDPLVVWGQILVGVALLLGVLLRWAAFWGVVMMLMFWLSHLEGGILEGLPVENGWVIDSTLVYAGILFGLAAIGAGRILGLDARLEDTDVVQNNAWLRYVLG